MSLREVKKFVNEINEKDDIREIRKDNNVTVKHVMSILSAFLGGMIIFIAVYALIYYSRTDNKIHENEVSISKLEERIVSMEKEIKFVRELLEKDNNHLQDTIKYENLIKSRN